MMRISCIFLYRWWFFCSVYGRFISCVYHRLRKFSQALWVIRGLFSVEDANIFYTTHRLRFAEKRASNIRFLPVPAISIPRKIAGYQLCRKGLCWKQHNCTIHLYYSLILLPQWVKRNDRVPFASCGSVRKVAQNQIHTLIWDCFHSLKAISFY